MHKIRNISNQNIIINGTSLSPGKSMKVNDLNKLKNLIKLGSIRIENLAENESNIQKDEIIESFFNLYFNKSNQNDIKNIVFFYQKIGFTKNLNPELLELLNNVDNAEELTCVLLNTIYPALINEYL